jgi:hypothetical protein
MIEGKRGTSKEGGVSVYPSKPAKEKQQKL